MSQQDFGIVIGMVASAILALGPWMFMVHAKLAVITAHLEDIEDRIEERKADKTKDQMPCSG